METLQLPTTARELALHLEAELLGNPDCQIDNIASLQKAGAGSLCFLVHRKYASHLYSAQGAVVLAPPELVVKGAPVTYVVVPEPQRSFAQIARRFARLFPFVGHSSLALVDPSAKVHPNAHIGPHVYVGPRSVIGANSVIYPFSYVSSDVQIGEECEIHPHVVIWEGTSIGNRVRILAGSVIGSDGFGVIQEGGNSPQSMPQLGRVIIEDDVRIGALCTVDRATLDETRIQAGTQFDDHVHIGHNVRVGKNNIYCAQVAIGGSSVIGDNVILGGKAGVGHGVTIGNDARLGAHSAATSNLKGGETYYLTPPVPVKESLRIIKYLRKLPEIWERLRRLEEKIHGEQDNARGH